MIHAKSMGPRRRVLWTFIIALTLAVAGREVPECANLEDDVSNDGGAVACVQGAVAKAPSRRLTSVEVALIRRPFVSLDKLPTRASPADPASKGGRDILHLLTLQRK
jgi:hypothetical protein